MPRISAARVRRNLGRRIGELRVALDLTQEKLAERLKVSPRWLQSVEAGRENLTIDTIVKIANGLRTDVRAFFENASTPRPKRGRPRRVSGLSGT